MSLSKLNLVNNALRRCRFPRVTDTIGQGWIAPDGNSPEKGIRIIKQFSLTLRNRRASGAERRQLGSVSL